MTSYRLNRLFNSTSGRCFDVAIDRGFFNEHGFLAGIEGIAAAVRTVVNAAPGIRAIRHADDGQAGGFPVQREDERLYGRW